MSEKTLKGRLQQEFEEFKNEIRKEFDEVDFVCPTADVWGSLHMSFLGVTAHWFKKSSGPIERVSAAIACKRFKGRWFKIF